MSSLIKRYRMLFIVANAMYLLPCNYNSRSRAFEKSWYNIVGLVLSLMICCSCLWLDLHAIEASVGQLSVVMLGIVVIYIIIYALMLIVFVLNAFYHRSTLVQLFNTLFAQDDWVLEWMTIKRTPQNVTIHFSQRHTGSLGVLTLFVLANCFYNVMFIEEWAILKLYWLLLVRFCGMFLMVELYRACVIIIKERMKQLQTLLMLTKKDSNVPIFLERFQRYYQLIDSVNQCFSIPVTYVLLLILFERTVAVYDVYDNFDRLSHMSSWEMFGFLFRQFWQTIYLAVVFMIGITSNLASIQVICLLTF